MSDKPDFNVLWARWERLEPGPKAELRRVRDPDALTTVPAFYRLTGGQAWPGWQRVAFCLPWAGHRNGADPLGTALARAGLAEKRLFQVIRSTEPNDLVQLRRLLQHVRPVVDWARFGPQIFYWNDENRRRLLEDFYHLPALAMPGA